jgi:hypothetical protein
LIGLGGNGDKKKNAGNDNNMQAGWGRLDEDRFVKSEDPEEVRLLYNILGAYSPIEDSIEDKETIRLKASPAKIRPGQKVRFEAIPSPETPKLPSGILLLADPLEKMTSLSREWFGKKYHGSFMFKETESGEFRFFITTLPQFNKKEKKMIAYRSNIVSVFVAPDVRKLSRIYLQEPNPIFIHVGSPSLLTLIAERPDGKKYNISSPGLGTTWSVDDESRATVKEEVSKGDNWMMLRGVTPGETTLRVNYYGLHTESKVDVAPAPIPANFRKMIPDPNDRSRLIPAPPPPRPDHPYAISPPDGAIVRVGEKVILEASSFDVSKGHIFNWSSWSVSKVNPKTGKQGLEVAYLRGGNSNIAEWIPRGTGIFEWTVKYLYAGDQRVGWTDSSQPVRIQVVE